jgi:formylglycine-generating enzyme required for sulfatase activity
VKKLAILVGIDDYLFIRKLRFANNDVAAFSKVLELHFGFDPDSEIIVLNCQKDGDLKARRDHIQAQLQKAKQCRDLDLFVFGFWGHGELGADGQRHLCSVDTQLGRVETTGVSLEWISDELQQVDTRNKLLLLDCCQNDPSRNSNSNTMLSGEEAVFDSMAKALARPISSFERRSNTVLLTGCRENQCAFEWSEREQGLFTAYLVEAFKAGFKTFGDVARSTQKMVPVKSRELFRSEQEPYLNISGADLEIPYPEILIEAEPQSWTRIILISAFLLILVASVVGISIKSFAPVNSNEPENVQPSDAVESDAVQSESTQEDISSLQEEYDFTLNLDEFIPMDFVWIPATTHPAWIEAYGEDTVTLGAMKGGIAVIDNEWPEQKVKIMENYWMSKTEVTHQQFDFQQFIENQSMFFNGLDTPIESISKEDAASFCRLISLNEKIAGRLPEGYTYQLPTEAQWEHAARAGNRLPNYSSEDSNYDSMRPERIDQIAWYYENRGPKPEQKKNDAYLKKRRTMVPYVGDYKDPMEERALLGRANPDLHLGPAQVASKMPNTWGLFDMIGNVSEWTRDSYKHRRLSEAIDPFEVSEELDSTIAQFGVIRGGSWRSQLEEMRAARRARVKSNSLDFEVGFRVALAPSEGALISPEPGKPWNVSLSSNKDMSMQWIPPTSSKEWHDISGDTKDYFLMGLKEDKRSQRRHAVSLSKGFWIGTYEVTQKQWQKVMGTTVADLRDQENANYKLFERGDNIPMYYVTWSHAMAFCDKLTKQERAAGRLGTSYAYRLPTEAQWEYACRSGTKTPYFFGDSLSTENANIASESELGFPEGALKSVGQYEPNAWGLYDMHGNVSELCLNDFYEYPVTFDTDPAANIPMDIKGVNRMVRGGSVYDWAEDSRSGKRSSYTEEGESFLLTGFRVALVPVN